MKRCTFEADCRRVPQAKSAVSDSLKKAGANLVTVNAKDRRGIVMGEVGKMHGETITPTSLGTIFAAIASTQAKLQNIILDAKELEGELTKFGRISITTAPNQKNDIGTVIIEIMKELEKLQLEISSIGIHSLQGNDGRISLLCTTQKPGEDTEAMGRVAAAIQDVLARMKIDLDKVTKNIISPFNEQL